MVAELDASAIADAFGLGADARFDGPPARGELGAVWPLRTALGRWAVKRGDEPEDATEVEETTRLQEAAIARGVLSPAPVRTTDGRLLADVAGAQVRVHEWCDLAALNRALDVVELGELLARTHTTDAAVDGPVDPWFSVPVGPAEWDEIVAAAAGAPFAAALAGHRDALVAAAGIVVAPTEPRACHRDLFADNVRTRPDGRLVVFDWDNAGPADPGHELGMVLWEYCRERPATASDFVAAYRDAGGPGRITGPESFSMIVCMSGRLLHRAARLWLDAASCPTQRVVRASAVAEWIRDPCTLPVIDTLLAAVGA